MARRKKPDTRAGILSAIRRSGVSIDLRPVTRYSAELTRLEQIFARLRNAKKPERVRLSNQEAYSLSALYRRQTQDQRPFGSIPIKLTKADNRRVTRWYLGQQGKADRDVRKTDFGKLVKAWDLATDAPTKMEMARAIQRHGFAFLGDDEKVRKFTSVDSFTRFVTLPHYKEAQTRMSGAFAMVEWGARGDIKRVVELERL